MEGKTAWFDYIDLQSWIAQQVIKIILLKQINQDCTKKYQTMKRQM